MGHKKVERVWRVWKWAYYVKVCKLPQNTSLFMGLQKRKHNKFLLLIWTANTWEIKGLQYFREKIVSHPDERSRQFKSVWNVSRTNVIWFRHFLHKFRTQQHITRVSNLLNEERNIKPPLLLSTPTQWKVLWEFSSKEKVNWNEFWHTVHLTIWIIKKLSATLALNDFLQKSRPKSRQKPVNWREKFWDWSVRWKLVLTIVTFVNK